MSRINEAFSKAFKLREELLFNTRDLMSTLDRYDEFNSYENNEYETFQHYEETNINVRATYESSYIDATNTLNINTDKDDDEDGGQTTPYQTDTDVDNNNQKFSLFGNSSTKKRDIVIVNPSLLSTNALLKRIELN